MAHETTSTPPPKLKHVGSATFWTHPVHKTLASAANLANLLPTGTVLALQTLAPSFSNKLGVCQLSNKCLTASLVLFCSILCYLSSFTDSFTDCDGKPYYGIATFNGLYIFNRGDYINSHERLTLGTEEGSNMITTTTTCTVDLSKFRISLLDLVHAFVSPFVFLVFAFSDRDLRNCFFPSNLDVLFMNLPLVAGVFSAFLFTIFPTTRRGIGYSDVSANFK